MKTKLYQIALKASLVVMIAGEAWASPEEHQEVMPHQESVHHAAEAAGHAAEHGSSGGLPQLDPTWYASQIFWLFVTFVAGYFIYSRSILPALSSTLESRRELIEGDLDMAKKMKEEAEQVHAAYDEILSDARKQASENIKSSEEKIKTKASEERLSLQEKTAEALRKTEKEIEIAKQEAMKDINTVAAEVASKVTKKLVDMTTDVNQAKSIIEKINKEAA